MMVHTTIGKERWDNAYQWTTDEFINFLSMFPSGTPIRTDLHMHARLNSNSYLEDYKEFTSKDKSFSMLIPQKEGVMLYIHEGVLPVQTLDDIANGKARNLIKVARDIVDKKEFLNIVFDIILEDE